MKDTFNLFACYVIFMIVAIVAGVMSDVSRRQHWIDHGQLGMTYPNGTQYVDNIIDLEPTSGR